MYVDDIDQPSLDEADIRSCNLDLSVLLKAKAFKNKEHKSSTIDASRKLVWAHRKN